MKINKIEIHNFRNFADCSFDLAQNAVIVGENKIGKSNLLFALRLVLDPRLADSDRHLRLEDFWDGIERPLKKEDYISVSVELSEFTDDDALIALLTDYAIQGDPMIARLIYLFRPIPTITEPRKQSDYEFVVYGGDTPEKHIGYDLRSQLPMTLLPALRDAEDDLSNWRRSPLAPLLQEVAGGIDPATLDAAAESVSTATKEIAEIDGVKDLGDEIRDRLAKMVGPVHSVDTSLSFSPADPERLIRSLRLFIDQGRRGIGDASLGCANLIYLSLMMLDLEKRIEGGTREHTFLAIEEPEAHLHPHLQRLAFRDFLGEDVPRSSAQNIILTTHSPHIVSVTPLRSLVVLKKSSDGKSTVASSAARIELEDRSIKDLERYIDVNRGECVFARGIILVEGIAETYILPQLAKALGYDFDELGISVCSVESTNFLPYAKLFGSKGLDIPFAILTDMDPPAEGGVGLGIARAKNLVTEISGPIAEGTDVLASAWATGIFLNNHTFEVDLAQTGTNLKTMCEVVQELTTNGAANARAAGWITAPATFDAAQFLKDVGEIKKGRYAQRLSQSAAELTAPEYVVAALEYVKNKIH